MLVGPFKGEAQRPSGLAATDDLQGTDVEQGFMLGIQRMEMRRRVFALEHLDDDAEELADRGHETASSIIPRARMQPTRIECNKGDPERGKVRGQARCR